MAEDDELRLSKTMAFLLRHRPDVGDLSPDDRGFVPVEDLCVAVSRLLRTEVVVRDVHEVVTRAETRRFEIFEGRIRALRRPAGPPRPNTPDILYHACTQEQVQGYLEQGAVRLGGSRPVWLSADESQAWRAAHRMKGLPRVLYVDTARGHRRRLRLQRHRRNGLYLARSLSLSDVLNLQPGFAEQLSAGGIPIAVGDDGVPRMALIQVTRRSGVTWEVAKGKLEPGETPEHTGIREVQEEMGVDVDFDVRCYVGRIRYGFMAPGGLPRLKTVFLYLLDPRDDIGGRFSPSSREGIEAVRWFTPDEAVRAVTHSSLIPVMKRARQLVYTHYCGGREGERR